MQEYHPIILTHRTAVGNPLYDWDAMERDGYNWWLSRIDHAMKLYDMVRIDHFRAFDTYYAIPADATTAEYGEWKKARV